MTAQRPPRKFLVTRHEGAITWYAQSGHRAETIEMTHFDVGAVQPGDIVIGTLPIHQAAAVCAAGGRYWHLALDVPAQYRGRELTADHMRTFSARLEEFRMESLGARESRSPKVDDRPADRVAHRTLHVCVATGEALANLVPATYLAWDHLVVLATPEMGKNAEHLLALACRIASKRGDAAAADACSRLDIASPTTLAMLEVEMKRAMRELRQRFPDCDIIVNATGGSKLMTQALVDAFRPHAHIFYCHMQQDMLEAIWPRSNATVSLPADVLDLESQLLGNSTRIVRQDPIGAAELEPLRARIRATATLALQGHSGKSQAFIAALHANGNAATSDQNAAGIVTRPFNPNHFVHPPHLSEPWQQALLRLLHDLKLIVNRSHPGNEWTFSFASDDAARYAAGGYLEEFALLSALDLGLPSGHVGKGVQLDSLHAVAGRRARPLNELDVAVVWRNRLLVMECKAGSQLVQASTSKPQDIVNKLGMLRREKAGPFGSAWLLSRKSIDVPSHADVIQRLSDLRIDTLAGPEALCVLPQRLRQWCGGDIASGGLDWKACVLT